MTWAVHQVSPAQDYDFNMMPTNLLVGITWLFLKIKYLHPGVSTSKYGYRLIKVDFMSKPLKRYAYLYPFQRT